MNEEFITKRDCLARKVTEGSVIIKKKKKRKIGESIRGDSLSYPGIGSPVLNLGKLAQ